MDIALFRNEKDILTVKESQRRRGRPIEEIDEVIRLDEAWKKGRSIDRRVEKTV